jgi:hypothetical protein
MAAERAMERRNERADQRRRRKIPLACEPCRERKSRCDGAKPICSTCQRRALPLHHCVYILENARTASNEAFVDLTWFLSVLDAPCRRTNVSHLGTSRSCMTVSGVLRRPATTTAFLSLHWNPLPETRSQLRIGPGTPCRPSTQPLPSQITLPLQVYGPHPPSRLPTTRGSMPPSLLPA